MWVGIGVGIGRNRFATGIFNAYALRVTADGGITEAGQCVDAVTGLLLNASLLLIPSGYKGGKLYAEIPTNGNGDLTWTRGSDAFRTNASGVLQRVPWNLLQYSEQFDNAAWIKSNATITSNAINAPNGTLTADKLIETTANGVHNAVSVLSPNVTTYTASFYAKAAERNFVYYSFGGPSWGGQGFMVNLTTGAVSQNTTGATPTVTLLTDGWVKIEASRAAVSTTQIQFQIFTGLDSTTFSYTGDSTKGIYIWGAQLVEGTTAQTYLPTTDRLNFPRLSYMYGSCPSVLLEPQRTNLALYSQDFDNAYWLKSNTNATANTTTSPDGSTNADTFSANGTTSVHALYKEILATSGVSYTATIYAKANTGRYFMMRIMTSSTYIRYGVTVDLQNGSITQTSATSTAPTGTSSSVTSVGNGWYRISLTMNSTNTSIGLLIESSNTGTPTLDSFLDYSYLGSESYYIYGAQLEAGAYPTTYIPTTSATATRVADSFSRNNIYTNGLISASGGTWFVEFAVNNTNTRDNSQGMFVGDSTNIYTGNQLVILSGSTGTIQFNKVVSGTGTTLYQSSNSQLKFAIKWNGSTADIFANGTKVISATAFTATNMENLIGQSGTPFFIKQMALFNTPLTDTQCQTLTT